MAQAYSLQRTSDFSSPLTDANKFIVSAWFKPTSPSVYTIGSPNYISGLILNFISTDPLKSATGFTFVDGTANGDLWNFYLYWAGNPSDPLDPVLINGGFHGSASFGFDTGGLTGTVIANDWNHFIMSYDGDTGNFWYALNDEVDSVVLLPSASLSFALTSPGPQADFRVGAEAEACMGYLYANIGESMDLSITANRRKFITVDNLPTNLGATGATPTGSTPVIYLPLAFASPLVNASGTGNFTKVGAGVAATCS